MQVADGRVGELANGAGAPQSSAAPAVRDAAVVLAVVLAAAAGVIHVKAAVDHASHWWLYGAAFGVMAYSQLGWALLLWRGHSGARFLALGMYGSLAIVAVWLLSRTVGVPFGPWAWDAEPVGAADVIATLDELLLAGVLGMLRAPDGRAARLLGWTDRGDNALRLKMMLGCASVLALVLGGHSHQ